MKPKYNEKDISGRIVSRLTLYLNILYDFLETKEEINSIELANKMNTTAVQVRKDLSTFGEFGVRGKGYQVRHLIETIESILGIDEENDIILIGYGKMGKLIASNTSDVLGKGFNLLDIFEKDPEKIGKKIKNLDLTIKDIKDVSRYIKENNVHTAILAVNSNFAQSVAQEIVDAGVEAILNMTTTKLDFPDNIAIVRADISGRLKELNFWRKFQGSKFGIDKD